MESWKDSGASVVTWPPSTAFGILSVLARCNLWIRVVGSCKDNMRPRFVRRKMHVWLWLVSAILNLVATTSFQGHHQLHRIVSWGTTHHVGPQILAATSSPSETRDVNVKTKTTAKKGVKKEVSSSSSTSRIKGVTKKNGKVKATLSKTKKPKKASSKSGESKETTSKKRKKKKKAEVMHWSVDSDVATLHLDEPRNVHFVVHGNPLPLRRHRTARGFMYNPSAKSQESFRNVTLHILNTTMDVPTANPTTPLFPAETPVIMSILFRMKRPKSHFQHTFEVMD
ncbi:expressed unknown protein [Seminavis robusta]|uniref:Uncharacterized protein n=1 Tax=Seminavis robusta TaxID=568900 RepID=A0A9N8H1X3_9STRA|nr:expressed unknown protein [Seminavis robusta]|eukprot:Sro50_g029310.1 n/a (283) ;mRNA; r:141222-142403